MFLWGEARSALRSEDLGLGAADKRGHVAFVFPGLGYISIISGSIFLKML